MTKQRELSENEPTSGPLPDLIEQIDVEPERPVARLTGPRITHTCANCGGVNGEFIVDPFTRKSFHKFCTMTTQERIGTRRFFQEPPPMQDVPR